VGQCAATLGRMRDDLLRGTTSSALALLRRAMTLHRATSTPEGARGRAPRAETAAGGIPRRADLDASRSRTERHLQVLGVGQAPDRAETGIPGFRW
jgi:hypothetical protein